MSVLIKDIKIPKDCYSCDLSGGGFGEDLYCIISGNFVCGRIRDKTCPLIDIPPHGRLIDGDSLKHIVKTDIVGGSFRDDYMRGMDSEAENVISYILQAPTIIEAEEK